MSLHAAGSSSPVESFEDSSLSSLEEVEETKEEVSPLHPSDLSLRTGTSVVDGDEKITGSTREIASRQSRLKRTNNKHYAKSTPKRRCVTDSTPVPEITRETVQQIDPDLSPEEVKAVLHDYNYARRILNRKGECNKKNESIPSLEFMINLVNDWRPRREMICMYVRWSKRLRRNYHLDSISTLLCVAKQCDYKPYVFLKNIKTLSITRSTTAYCLNFRFDTSNYKSIDGKKLNEKFLGLSITLRLLQQSVVPCDGTLGSIGLKSNSKKNAGTDRIILSEENNRKNRHYSVADKPTSKFHTTNGLTGRIWMAIQHRWIALQVVEILFPSQLAQADSEHESLAFSFQMHATAGPTRFDYLDPIIGVCLRYRSTSIIDAHGDVLQSVWNDPRSFVSFGSRLLQSMMSKDILQCIVDTFRQLYDLVEKGKNLTLHRKTDRNVRWQMVRGYAFHFWLERSQNEQMQRSVETICKQSTGGTLKQKKTPRNKPVNPIYEQQDIAMEEIERECTMKDSPVLCTDMDGEGVYTGDTLEGGGLSEILTTRQTTVANHGQHESESEGHVNESHLSYTIPADRTDESDTSCSDKFFATEDIRLATQSEMTSVLSSHLLIHRNDGITVAEELSPLEVYSANMLCRDRHSRKTVPREHASANKCTGVVLSIDADIHQFIDVSSKAFHVAREDSSFFKEHGELIPSFPRMIDLCKAVFKYGKSDPIRSSAQFRVNIGCGGQHRPNGKPVSLIGLQFKKKLDVDPEFQANDVISTIGRLTEFTWNILKDMQHSASDVPLAPDASRRRQYASHLSAYLRMNDDVGFEDITVVVGILFPLMPCVAEHTDCMNDSIAGYTRTGAFNVVLVSGETPNITMLHLQVICNFRRVIREYLLPMQSLLTNVVGHCKHYLGKWQANMNRIFGGKTSFLPEPLDRRHFFMDDSLPFETIAISSGDMVSTPTIHGEYLLTEISPSRVLSFSMFIDPIFDLREILCYDQQIELCFVASILSNPFWFEYTVTSMTRRHMDSGDPFCFGIHPLYDWARETISVFGAWQGGPYNRWSPCGGSTPFPNLFGAHIHAMSNELTLGQARLEEVIQILYGHLRWVDNLHDSVKDRKEDLSIPWVDRHMASITDAIFKIVPCQFSIFRLMVFTTICAGCGIIKDGSHLKSLMYPVKGSASFKHLMKRDDDRITRKKAVSLCTEEDLVSEADGTEDTTENIESDRHDQLMMYVSYELGMPKYLRDETECILCEAHPNRNLKCRDWFKKGRRIYDLNRDGILLQKEYGAGMPWVRLPTWRTLKFAYLDENVVYITDNESLKILAMDFGHCLQREKDSYRFCGRGTKTSDYVQEYSNQYMTEMSYPFTVMKFRAANFYYGCHIRDMNMNSMQVLGDGEKAVNMVDGCNDIERFPSGVRVWDFVLDILFGSVKTHNMYSARYHQHQEESGLTSRTVVFPGHLDKAFVKRAIFLPLTSREFFTILAVPSAWLVQQHDESYRKMQDWMKTLSADDCETIHLFIQKFQLMARIAMKIFDVDVRIYHNTAGSVLSFPPNKCFHTTMIPANISGVTSIPRDLFIIHTTAGTNQ